MSAPVLLYRFGGVRSGQRKSSGSTAVLVLVLVLVLERLLLVEARVCLGKHEKKTKNNFFINLHQRHALRIQL